MKKYIFLYVCIAIMVCASFQLSYSADTTEYQASENRDPFTPLVTKDGKMPSGYSTIKTLADVRLEGIVYDPKGSSIAIINGIVFNENDKVDNIKVVKIDANKVTFLFKETKHIIDLKE